jgi:glutathione S-transferase
MRDSVSCETGLDPWPARELARGGVLVEITAICEYLDQVAPPPLPTGETPNERAAPRISAGHIDLGIVEPMTNGFRFAEGLPLFQGGGRVPPLNKRN